MSNDFLWNIEAVPYGKTDSFSIWYRGLEKSGFDSHNPVSRMLLGTPKIHGTNASVIIANDKVYAQSRNRLLTVEDDNYGFARWVKEREDWFLHIYDTYRFDRPLQLYGEFAGKSVQSNVGVSELDKFFYLFTTNIRYQDLFKNVQKGIYTANDFEFYHVISNIFDETQLYDELMEHTQVISDRCPVAVGIANMTGVELQSTIGEGIVWVDYLGNKFKTKTDAHRGSTERVIHKEIKKTNVKGFEEYFSDSYLQKAFEGLQGTGHRDKIGQLTLIPELVKWLSSDFTAEQGDDKKDVLKEMVTYQIRRYKLQYTN